MYVFFYLLTRIIKCCHSLVICLCTQVTDRVKGLNSNCIVNKPSKQTNSSHCHASKVLLYILEICQPSTKLLSTFQITISNFDMLSSVSLKNVFKIEMLPA